MQVVWSPALVIGLYTVAVLRPRRDALIAAALLRPVRSSARVHVFGSTGASSAASLVAVVVAATVLGLYIRTRRDAARAAARARPAAASGNATSRWRSRPPTERARIAREMHDIVAHHLTVMVTLVRGRGGQAAGARSGRPR